MASFFRAIGQDDQKLTIEAIYARYASADSVLQMDIVHFCELLNDMQAREEREILRNEYNSLLPWMVSGFLKNMSFNDYVDMRISRNIDTRPAAEILAEVHAIKAQIEREG